MGRISEYTLSGLAGNNDLIDISVVDGASPTGYTTKSVLVSTLLSGGSAQTLYNTDYTMLESRIVDIDKFSMYFTDGDFKVDVLQIAQSPLNPTVFADIRTTNLTVTRSYEHPDKSGTYAMLSDIVPGGDGIFGGSGFLTGVGVTTTVTMVGNKLDFSGTGDINAFKISNGLDSVLNVNTSNSTITSDLIGGGGTWLQLSGAMTSYIKKDFLAFHVGTTTGVGVSSKMSIKADGALTTALAIQNGNGSVTSVLGYQTSGYNGFGTITPTARLHVAGGNLKVEGLTDADLLNTSHINDSIGIGGLASSSYKLKVFGNVDIDNGLAIFNKTPISNRNILINSSNLTNNGLCFEIINTQIISNSTTASFLRSGGTGNALLLSASGGASAISITSGGIISNSDSTSLTYVSTLSAPTGGRFRVGLAGGAFTSAYDAVMKNIVTGQENIGFNAGGTSIASLNANYTGFKATLISGVANNIYGSHITLGAQLDLSTTNIYGSFVNWNGSSTNAVTSISGTHRGYYASMRSPQSSETITGDVYGIDIDMGAGTATNVLTGVQRGLNITAIDAGGSTVAKHVGIEVDLTSSLAPINIVSYLKGGDSIINGSSDTYLFNTEYSTNRIGVGAVPYPNTKFGIVNTNADEYTFLALNQATTSIFGVLETGVVHVVGQISIGNSAPTSLSSFITNGDIEHPNTGWVYSGDPSTDGSWRFGSNGATDFLHQRRVAGAWVTKQTIAG